jgi:hypothetical protein
MSLKGEHMSKARQNLDVINNFILHLTHVSEGQEEDQDKVFPYTPAMMYQAARVYIAEDHVDGKDGADCPYSSHADDCDCQGVQLGRLRTELYYAISEARKWADAEGYDISDKLKCINDRLEVDL